MRRLEAVMQHELTDLQKAVLTAIYYDGKKQVELAKELGVSPSSVCRALQRAQSRLRRYLQY